MATTPGFMSNDVDLDSLIQSLPACKRCRDCRRGCDTLLPACRQCTKAGVECVFFDHGLNEFLPRSYIASLVDHVRSITARPHTSPAASAIEAPQDAVGNSSARTESVTSEPHHCEHHFAYAGGSYRYLGASACLIPPPRVQQTIETTDSTQEFGSPSPCGNVSVDSAMHNYLVQTFFENVDPLYPILDRQLRFLAPQVPSNLAPSEIFSLHMLYSITCHVVSVNDPRYAAFGESSFLHAMSFLEASTLEPTISTLQAVLLLAVNSLFDPKNGNLGQQIALASRLALDLEMQELATHEVSLIQRMHSAIFSIENELASTLDRPATFPEPIWGLSFDPQNPSEYLCSLYRLQNRFRKGDKSVLNLLPPPKDPSPDHCHPVLKPALRMALHQTHFLLNPSPENALHVLDSIMQLKSIYMFLTPHWVYQAATFVLQNREALSPGDVNKIIMNAVIMLTKAERSWHSSAALLKRICRMYSEIFGSLDGIL